MKTPARRQRPTIVRLYPVLIGLMVLIAAVLMAPSHSADSTWLMSSKESVIGNRKTVSHDIANRFRSPEWISPLALPALGETIAIYASDCATPKTSFNAGEIICATTNGVDLNDGDYTVNWVDSNLTITNGGAITTNPQTFLFAIPTTASTGLWKATIGRANHSTLPDDSSIIGTPPTFTVGQGAALATFAADCVTPKTTFNLGETVCGRASGLAGFRFAWIGSNGFIRQRTSVTSDPQTDSFGIPSDPTTVIAGAFTIDNRGEWRLNAITSRGSSRAGTFFTVKDPQNAAVDLGIFNTYAGSSAPGAGDAVAYSVTITNRGPDDAANVHFVDDTFTGATFVSVTQTSGPPFTCTGSTSADCTGALMPKGSVAKFTVVLTAGPAGGVINNKVNVSSSTAELDAGDNSSEGAPLTIRGTGSTACTLDCPGNITVGTSSVNSSGQAGAIVTFANATPSGTCGTITSIPASGSFFALGSSVVTQETSSGESCSFVVTVVDDDAPTITCPSNITVNEPTAGAGANVTYTGLTASDNSGSATISCTENGNPRPSGSNFAAGTYTVTCTATDEDNNSSPSCSFDVTVNAATNCTLTPPANISVDSPANACAATVTYNDPTTEDCTAGTTISCDYPSGSSFPVGTTVVTCKSSPDGATTSFTVTVNDVTAPVPNLSTLPTVTGECSATAGVPTVVDPPGPTPPFTVSELPTATDGCDATISGTTNDRRTYDEPGTYTVTWHYTDAAGNDATQTQTVVVTGPTGGLDISGAPVVGVHNPAGSTSCVMVIDDLTSILNTTVSGTCGAPEITRTISPAPGDGNDFTVGTAYTVVSTATEGSNTDSVTQIFKIIDDTAPVVVSVPANATYQCLSEVPAGNPSDATATDNCVNPTISVADTTNGGAGSPSSPLIITRTFTATDVSSGLTHSKAQTITVVDNTAPTLNAPNIVVSNDAGSCAAVVNFTGLNASDNCGTANINTTIPSGTSFPKGTTTVTATATDAAGNQTVKDFTVTVNDTEFPTITYPATGVTAYLPLNSTATSMAVNYSVTAADNCAGVILDVVPASGSVFPVGPTTVTATATDASGNVTTKQFTVTVLYNFTGFFSPVNNLPTFNNVNAGRAIPIKFSLSGDKGLNIFAAGYPVSQQIACDSSAPIADVEGTITVGGSTLTYSPDQYHYNWKTELGWMGTCRVLTVKLNDGSDHKALFKFK